MHDSMLNRTLRNLAEAAFWSRTSDHSELIDREASAVFGWL